MDNKKFLSLITRYLNEPFLEEFVEYYMAEGVDHIFVLYDVDSTIPINDNVKNNTNVSIIDSYNFKKRQNMDVNTVYSKIRKEFKWNILVDCDEFITSTDPTHTLRQELSVTYKNVDCVKIPWVMMSSGDIERDPGSILQHLTTRWNHDLKHPHPENWRKGRCRYSEIEVKCISKCDTFSKLGLHFPDKPNKLFICMESIHNQPTELNSFYKNLREKNIANATLLCYHYRIFSKESAQRKLLNNKLDGYKPNNLHKLLQSDHSDKEEMFMRNKSIAKFGHK
jgi:hypothetical protein